MTQCGRSRALVALLVGVLAAFSLAPAVSAQPVDNCVTPGDGDPICGEFMTYWEGNGGLPVFGIALTEQFVELNSDTLIDYDVQYLERQRFELHPENAGTPYNVLLGRLGVNVLEGEGINWMDFEQANPSDAHYMPATHQAIAPEFWDYWSSHGLDLGDPGVSFRESLALFGYPVSPAAMDTNADGDTVLTQWYERARFELHGDTVLLGRLGAEMLDDSDGFSIRFRNELQATFEVTFDRFSSPGMLVGVWQAGAGSWESTIGVADWDSGAQYTPDTHQRIGSITKTFTSVLILQLVDEGLLSLDDTVDEWFDGVTYGDQITIRQMLSMTSGIASYTLSTQWQTEFFAGQPDRVWTTTELVDFALSLPPSFMPGEFFEYSNTNFLMLGMIVEFVTGQTYAEVIQERIFDPLGMANSSSPLVEDTLPEPFARGITEQGQPEGETTETTNWNPAWGFGTGNLVSTYDDVYLWGRALGTGALLSEEMFAEQLTWDTQPPTTPDMSYGLGVGYYGNNWIGHEGSLPGYNTDLLYNTELDATIIVLTNSDITIPNPDNPNSPLKPASTTGKALRAVLEKEVELQAN